MHQQEGQFDSFQSCTLYSTPNITFNSHKTTEDCQSYGHSQSSRQSSIFREELILKKKKQQMHHVIEKYQQQKKCIKELQEYIDQLQLVNKQQQQQIQRLQISLKQLRGKNEQKIDKKSVDINENNKLWNTMREQFYLYEGEKKKWELQKDFKERELHLELQLQNQKYNQMKNMYESKITDIQNHWRKEQKNLKKKIKLLENAQKMAVQESLQLKSKVAEQDDFKEVLKARKDLTNLDIQNKKQNINDNTHSDIYRREIDKLNNELRKVKKQNIKMQKMVQSKQIDLQKAKKDCLYKDKKLQQIQQKNQYEHINSERQRKQLKQKIQKEQEQNQTVRNKYHSLQRQHQSYLRRERSRQSNCDENQKIKAQLRKRRKMQLLKMDKIFMNIDKQLDF